MTHPTNSFKSPPVRVSRRANSFKSEHAYAVKTSVVDIIKGFAILAAGMLIKGVVALYHGLINH